MPCDSPIKVVLIDDQPMFLKGLRLVLESEGLEVVGQAHCGGDALWLVNATKPDVVLMDLRMPQVDGVEATRQLHLGAPDVPVVVLTTFDDDVLVFDALRAGAVGYLLKGAPTQDLVHAIKATVQGKSVLTPSVSRKVISEFMRMSHVAPRTEGETMGLSPRECEVLKVLMTGASNKEIAHVMQIAEGTVKNHMSRILEKLGVTSRIEAALKARELGVV